jgi:tetratricopeptide (TPR) repeat protein
VAKALVNAHPESKVAFLSLGVAEATNGHWQDATAANRRAIDKGADRNGVYNNMAWGSLFFGGPKAADVDLALQTVQASNFTQPNAVHTLALIYAEGGKTREAQQMLNKLIELRPGQQLTPIDYAVVGRIAEQLGLLEVAEEAYSQVPKQLDAMTTYRYVQGRLELMRKAKAE